MAMPVHKSIKDLTEPRSIHELPPSQWCKLRKWAADNAYTLIFLSFGNIVTWALLIFNIYHR